MKKPNASVFQYVLMAYFILAIIFHVSAFHYFYTQSLLSGWILVGSIGSTMIVTFLMFLSTLDID